MAYDLTTLYNNKQKTIHSLEEFHEIVAPDSKANIEKKLGTWKEPPCTQMDNL